MILQVLLSEHKFCCGFLVNAFRVTCGPGPHIMCARSKPVFHRGDSSGSNLFRQTPKRGSWSRDLFPNYELLDLATMALPIMVDTAVRTDCLARQGSYFHLKGTVKACQNSGGKVFRKQLLRSFFKKNISWFHLQCMWHSFMRHLLKMRGTWYGANRKSIVLARGWVQPCRAAC